MKKLLVVGAGGHGKVVADAASLTGQWKTIAFVDSRYANLKEVINLPVIADEDSSFQLLNEYSDVIIAIGDNLKRYELGEKYQRAGFNLVSVIHPSATISQHASIAPGIVILANAVVNPDARVGTCSIINTGAIVEHDCAIEKSVHISPHATLAGNVSVGEFSWIGMGANIIQDCQIGKHCICGAGSVVLNNISDHSTVVGIPAK